MLSPNGTIVASKRFDGAFDNMYFFYHYDKRGSVTSILDPDAKRVKGYGYDEFGETEEVGSKSFLNEVKFTGAVHDTATGLYYMNARHYNPDTGRFISQDTYKGTASDPWSQHLYAYTTNNPVNFIDPTGHLPIYEDENGYVQKVSPNDIPKSSWPGNNKVPYVKKSGQGHWLDQYDKPIKHVPWDEDPISRYHSLFSVGTNKEKTKFTF
ncbi:RHS repeat-associated core domain-containing protein [Bacillus salipaludis]|uniref:RHS repeat-associated core domain-containing protein n=1 Tax=Bacillus salipaludis TaxID=2547811 RepID=A0ABW8RFC5_9BACI